MGLISFQGSSAQTSSATQKKSREQEQKLLPENSTTLVEGGRYLLPDDGTFADDKIIRSVSTNATAFNQDRFPDALNLTFAYPNGYRIPVTYFNQTNPSAIGRANPTDVSTGQRHNSHVNYLKIINFELSFQEELNYQYEDTENHTTATGVALTLPGFQPRKGDMFYLMLNDGQWGVFTVREIQRLSISSGSYHSIQFELTDYLTPTVRDYMESQVIEKAYFERTKFLTQHFTMLNHDSYVRMGKLKQLRKAIVDYYFRKYWDQTTQSLCHPKGYYDPYLIRYLQTKISLLDFHTRPKQLYARMYDYDSSLWHFINEASHTNVDQVTSAWRLRLFIPNYWSGDITGLAGNFFVQLGEKSNDAVDYTQYEAPRDVPQDTCYAGLSAGFYAGRQNEMTDFEQLLYLSITGTPDIDRVVESVGTYATWSPARAFYDIPIALHLIDQALFLTVE